MGRQQHCVDCRKTSPETNSDHTLISAQFGWRVVRRDGPGEASHIEWRCPACWQVYKRARALETGEEPPESMRGSRSSFTEEAQRGSRASFTEEAAARGARSPGPDSSRAPGSGAPPPPSSRRPR